MARLCKNCGTNNSFGSRYCEECGQKLEVRLEVPTIKKPVKVNKNAIITLSAFITVIMLLILIINSFGSIEQSLDMYFRGIQKNQIENFIASFPPQVENIFTQKSIIDGIRYEDFKSSFDEDYAYNYNKFGERFRVRYSIKVKEYWSREEINLQKTQLYDIWRIPKTSVKDIITVNLQVTLRGESQEQTYTMALDMIKIHGKWYVYPDYDAFMHPIR
ncbi:MAG: zinc ribbon domain-containing protein [Clostridia bacterium]|jgi:hypothetical protein|nr:zinc ribbon domain-containing protein [Clostridia bacterium]NLV34153.1 zinc ribbon domain-containing protein [Clostridiaceae bacterium]HQM96719.1 zinc ribbon domain-containing protein [Clostridia bacterium]